VPWDFILPTNGVSRHPGADQIKSFDLAAGGGVVGSGVLLGDAVAAELGFEVVAAGAASRSGKSDGVDHAVVGQGGGWIAMLGSGLPEGRGDDGGGHGGVG
jgi:hypothetical protein